MNNLIRLLSIMLVFVSCVKEPVYPPCTTNYPTTQNNGEYSGVDFLDGCWTLMGGTMYVENLDTDETDELFLFSVDNESSLRYDGIPLYSIESLFRYETTWCFNFPSSTPGNGSFTLDGDTVQPYGLNVTSNNITVTEDVSGRYQLLGGSAKPINYEIVSVDNKVINIYIQETYENIDGYNYYYFSKLKFKKL